MHHDTNCSMKPDIPHPGKTMKKIGVAPGTDFSRYPVHLPDIPPNIWLAG